MQIWWAHPTNIALMMLVGFGFGIGAAWPSLRSAAVEIGPRPEVARR